MPTPKSQPIQISELQLEILTKISRQTTSSVREVERSRLILGMYGGKSNSRLKNDFDISRDKVRHWRDKWITFESVFQAIEIKGGKHLVHDLEEQIRYCLSDAPRPGAPCTFTSEQYCGILSIALEAPGEQSDRPITHWTNKEIAAEAQKRGIVSSISTNQVRLFLKGGRFKTP